MSDQLPALALLAPFLAAFVVAGGGLLDRRICLPAVLGSLSISVGCSVSIFVSIARSGGVPIAYGLGSWRAPFGIAFRIDPLNALVLLVISVVAFGAAVYSWRAVQAQTPDRVPQFYALFLLLVVGLMGMTITGDAFNLYVLLEISSLSSYALVAMGSRRASVACFNYLIVGTIGASFYLLGVGYLYLTTGSLNMVDISRALVETNLYGSRLVLIAFILIMVGVWMKMAFFPLHAWLPNAYTFAPTAASCLIAPLMTKVAVYVMLRMMLTVFTPSYVYESLQWGPFVVTGAVVAIVAGSVLALAQSDLRKMMTYLIVAEVGYMVGGAWLANEKGLTGAIYHIAADAAMTLCLFLSAGALYYKLHHLNFKSFDGLFRRMPLTMSALVVGALSMIGIPPTCGFFSKYYLISAGIEEGQWMYVGALLLSSLVNAVLFFRVFEFAHFGRLDRQAGEGHHATESAKVDEAPATMLIPLLTAAASLLLLGLFAAEVRAFALPFISSLGVG